MRWNRATRFPAAAGCAETADCRGIPRSVSRGGRWQMMGWCAALLGVVLASIPLSAYYPFLHWRVEDGQLVAMPERFDLRELPGRAVPVVVSRAAALGLAEGDSWEAVQSQLRLALRLWSQVPNSSLRLLDAGEVAPDLGTQAPHIQVVFDELPPGVIGMAGPVAVGQRRRDDAGSFLPIAKSMVILNGAIEERPSYSEAFFLTLMHELGHAVGLQHTFTSSVMSTGVTRSTTKASPLAVDDHAGTAFLYPGKDAASDTGVIRGRVTIEGEPLHFAPVTALMPSGAAVSTLTLPDGSYEIRGLPSGRFYVYAQAAPSSSQAGLGPGQIVLPRDEAGEFIAPGPTFGTRFFPAAPDWKGAFMVEVQPGTQIANIDIDVPRQAESVFRGVTTYSFPGGFAVNPAIVRASETDRFLVAYAPNLTDGERVMEGLEVESIGASVGPGDVYPYPWAPEFLQVNIRLNPFSATGPKSLVWKRGSDLYVQPAAFLLVGQRPPELSEVTTEASEDGERIRIDGTELGAVGSYLVDGLAVPAATAVDSGDANRVTAFAAPFSNDGRPAAVVALAKDGQSSLYLGAKPPFAATRTASAGDVRIHPSSLPVGVEAMLTLEADAPVFAGNSVNVSFGHPGIAVNHLWKVSAHRVVLSVAISGNADLGSYPVTFWNDLAKLSPGAALTLTPPVHSPFANGWRLMDVATDHPTLYPGSVARVQFPDGWVPPGAFSEITILLGDVALPAVCVGPQTCEFSVPGETSFGVKPLAIAGDDASGLPVAVEIAEPPPYIVQASGFSRSLPVGLLDGILARFSMVVELPEVVSATEAARGLKVRVSGQSAPNVQATPSEEGGNRWRITFDLRLPRAAVRDGHFRLRAEWLGRPSPEVLVRETTP
ncbi:MAG: matrixin family metalloprotease [Bryobacterales bacterium]|nr:matrixin family metalloprotease [Bryobacterales bacterium]